MMVSTATAVLPVWRSPMMSSRWPRPIGTMASIALRPVCTGCDTDWRAITPGATFSMTSVSLALIGPLPSIGAPRELTTRPSSSGPMGTERILPVHLTVSPSVMCSYSPRITAPTESRSRLRARPKVLFGNSSISHCITSERPCRRQMPSVTEITVPWVRICAPASRFWIRFLMSSEISEGLSCMCSSLSFQCGLERAELRARGTVDDLVADDDLDAANEVLIDENFCSDLAAGSLFQPLHQVGDLGRVHLEGRVDLRLHRAFTLVLQYLVLRANLRQHVQAAVSRQDAHEIFGLARELAGEYRYEQPRDLRRREIRVAHRRLDTRVRRHGGEIGERRRPLGKLALPVGQPERGLRVRAGNGAGFGHQSCFLMPSSRSACALASTSRRRIFSAPATASIATWSRNCSSAREASCWISALAAAFSRPASSRAAFFASSTSCAERFSACDTMSAARPRASAIASSDFFFF